MSISKEQLADLTELVNERIAEWEFLETMSMGSRLSRGVVRLVFDVIDEWQESDNSAERAEMEQLEWRTKVHDSVFTEGWQAGRESIRREMAVMSEMSPACEEAEDKRLGVVSNGNGIGNVLSKQIENISQGSKDVARPLSEQVTATLGPEHVVVTPLKMADVARMDADEILDLTLGSEEKAALLREIIGELQVMSKGGEMPSMDEYDERRPLHLGKARAITQRYSLTWGRLAEYAHLRFDLSERKGRRHGVTP